MEKAVGGLLMASAVAWLSLRDGRLQERYVDWRLGRLPRVRLGEVGDLPVRVVGRVRRAAEPLLAPLSDRPCVAFRLRIAEIHGRGFRRLVLDLRGAVPFVLVDDSGLALIEPNDTRRLALQPDLTGTIGGVGRRRPAASAGYHVFSLLEAHGTNTVTWLGGEKAYSFQEGVLALDAPVAIGGLATRELYADGERPTSRVFPDRLVFRNGVNGQLWLSTFGGALGSGR